MRTPMIIAALCAVSPAAHAVDLGPLAPAAEGKVQCVSPNAAARTCSGITTYSVDAKGVIHQEETDMVSSSPFVIMTLRTTTHIKGTRDCGMNHPEQVAKSTFTIEGRPADAAQTARLRVAAGAILKPTFGHEICADYRPLEDGLLGVVTIDGAPYPQLDRKVLWVSPSEGWRVGL